jgi:sialate O-acetylesterase
MMITDSINAAFRRAEESESSALTRLCRVFIQVIALLSECSISFHNVFAAKKHRSIAFGVYANVRAAPCLFLGRIFVDFCIMKKRLFLLPLCLLGSALQAEVKLPQLISDGMIMQRGEAHVVYGWADSGEKVTVTFDGQSVSTKADENGDWSVSLKEHVAGGPWPMTIDGENHIELPNVYVGDVWICSGQSNMELPIRRVRGNYMLECALSENDYIRQFKVHIDYDFNGPKKDVNKTSWMKVDPESINDFSAVGYFFARDVYSRYKVPVGIINSSVGGSPIEAWMSEDALQAYPDDLKEGIKYRDDSLIEEAKKKNDEVNAEWYGTLFKNDKGLHSNPKWDSPQCNDSDWATMRIPGYWDEQGMEKNFIGSVWFRKTFELPERLDGVEGALDLGTMVDSDEVYINGVQVGKTGYMYPPRRYGVRKGILKAGTNSIVIRAISSSGRGYFTYDKPFQLVADGFEVNLRGNWKYRVGTPMGRCGSTTFLQWKPMGLYNAMLAPLSKVPVKGVLWYQGESNISRAFKYRDQMEIMINDWRKTFNQPELPFIIAQLPNMEPASDCIGNSGWAEMREQERKALEIPHTCLTVNYDLGVWNDIHPELKKPVGERLADSAYHFVYGEETVVGSGPLVKSAVKNGATIVLNFDEVGSGLMVHNGGKLRCFAVAGADKQFVKADAKIVGDTVEVNCSQVEKPVYIRYAWADNPLGANLYNADGLPASPFEMEIK